MFVLALSKTFSINLQLLGGIWILQTFPSIVAGLYTRWFHRWALLAGWAAAMVWGTIVAYNQPSPGEPGTHFGASTAIVPVLGHTAYIAVTAFVLNLVVAVLLTWVFRALKLREGTDETQAAAVRRRPRGPLGGARRPGQLQVGLVDLADQVDAEAVVRLLLDQREAARRGRCAAPRPARRWSTAACARTRPAGRTPGRSRPGVAEAVAPGLGVHEQDAQLRGVRRSAATQKTQPARWPSTSAIQAASRRGSWSRGVVGHDAGDQRLEAGVPAELGRRRPRRAPSPPSPGHPAGPAGGCAGRRRSPVIVPPLRSRPTETSVSVVP